MKDIIELANLLDDLDRNHAAMNRDVSVYSEAATAIRLLAANVGGGEAAIRALEQEVEVLRREVADETSMYETVVNLCAEHERTIERLQEHIRRARRHDDEVDFCDECAPAALCPVHLALDIELLKAARELAP